MIWKETLMIERAVGVIIKNEKVLLFHRFNQGKEYWVFPGGGIEEGETPEIAVDREIDEELTLKVKQKKFIFKVFNVGRWEYHFLITEYEGEPKLGGPELEYSSENQQFIPTWVPIEEMKNLEPFYPAEGREKLLEIYSKKEL